MSNSAQAIKYLKKEKDFLICIDSDGCAFDAMEIKHKECFIPQFIYHWNLQKVSKYAREAWEFVNLYSVMRGCNRFQALVYSLDLLAQRPEVVNREYCQPDISPLRDWVERETKLSNPALEAAVSATHDPVLEQTLRWTKSVNQSIEEMVHGVPPFPYVKDLLEKAAMHADLMVVSAASGDALSREWNEHGLGKYMKVLAGQEAGTKKEQIQAAKESRYESNKILMVGDALGDLNAAKANGANFYPILPGREEESWKKFLDEGLEKFLEGKYAGAYEEQLIEKFKTYLPANPSWK